MTDITACARDTNSSVAKLWAAARDYLHGGILGKAEAAAMMAEALGTIVLGLGPCEKATTDVEDYKKLVKYLSDPRYYTVHNALTLALNTAEERKQLGAFEDAWGRGDFRMAGFVLTTLILDVLEHPSIPSSNGTSVAQIAYGLGQGFAMDVNITCFKDVRVEIPALIGGVIDIATGVGIPAGLESLFHGLEGLVPTFKDCMADKPKIMNLLHTLKDFKHPSELAKKLAQDIVNNGVDISLEVASAVLDYKSRSWQRFGEDIGKIINKIVIGDVMSGNTTLLV